MDLARRLVVVDPLLQKLNFKGHARLVVLAPPPAFGAVLRTWSKEADIASRVVKEDDFVLAFVEDENALRSALPKFAKLAAPERAVMWVAYPKGTSKLLRADINRTRIHAIVQEFGFELNRNVALDDDWSALRFKPLA